MLKNIITKTLSVYIQLKTPLKSIGNNLNLPENKSIHFLNATQYLPKLSVTLL